MAGEVEPPDRSGPGLGRLGHRGGCVLAEAVEEEQRSSVAGAQLVQGEVDTDVTHA